MTGTTEDILNKMKFNATVSELEKISFVLQRHLEIINMECIRKRGTETKFRQLSSVSPGNCRYQCNICRTFVIPVITSRHCCFCQRTVCVTCIIAITAPITTQLCPVCKLEWLYILTNGSTFNKNEGAHDINSTFECLHLDLVKLIKQSKSDKNKMDDESIQSAVKTMVELKTVSKEYVRDILASSDEAHKEISKHYMREFNFASQRILEAFRKFAAVVMCVGESQQLNRIINHFSQRYNECNNDVSIDSCENITTTVLTVNTLMHNPNVKKRVSYKEFMKYFEDCSELDVQEVHTMYKSMKENPIRWTEDVVAKDPVARKDSKGYQVNVENNRHFGSGYAYFKPGKLTSMLKRKSYFLSVDNLTMTLFSVGEADNYFSCPRPIDQDNETFVLNFLKTHQGVKQISIHHAIALPHWNNPQHLDLILEDGTKFLMKCSTDAEKWASTINYAAALLSKPRMCRDVIDSNVVIRPTFSSEMSTLTMDEQMKRHAAQLVEFQEIKKYLQTKGIGTKKDFKYLHRQIEKYGVYKSILRFWNTPYDANELPKENGDNSSSVGQSVTDLSFNGYNLPFNSTNFSSITSSIARNSFSDDCPSLKKPRVESVE